MPAKSLVILTASELYQRTRSERSNRDLFAEKMVDGRTVTRLHYLCPSLYHKQIHFTVCLGRRIVAIGSTEMYDSEPGKLYIAHVSVETKHEGKGLARLILESIYAYAVQNGLKVVPSAFSELGQRLKHICNELDAKYPQAASGVAHEDHYSGYASRPSSLSAC